MSEPKKTWAFEWEVWMKAGQPNSFKYKVLSGGPSIQGWRSIVEVHCENTSFCLVLSSKDNAEFDKRLLSWIRTWWDPKQRVH